MSGLLIKGHDERQSRPPSEPPRTGPCNSREPASAHRRERGVGPRHFAGGLWRDRRDVGHVVGLSQKGATSVGLAALITWSAGVLAGLYMLLVWLIENDVTGRHTAPSQLRVPVIFGHLALAIAGLGVWVAYLVLDRDVLAWASVAALTAIILLGLTMF